MKPKSNLIKKIILGLVLLAALSWGAVAVWPYVEQAYYDAAHPDKVVPEFGDMQDVWLVFTGDDEYELHFVDQSGNASEAYNIYVKSVDDAGFQHYVAGGWRYATWSPDGNFIALIAQFEYGEGAPILVSTGGEIITCSGYQPPQSNYRIWVLQDMKILMVDKRNYSETSNSVVIYDMVTCQVDEILYRGAGEFVDEAMLSSQGWLAIAINGETSQPRIKIISPDGDMYFILGGADPSWSVDGEHLAFLMVDEGLYYSDITGEERVFISPDVYQGGCLPTWSPDGEWIAFGLYNSDRNTIDIYKYNLRTQEQVLIAENGYAPNWRWNIQD